MNTHIYSEPVKEHFQLSIDSAIKRKLEELSARTGLPIARIIDKILREQLHNYEERFSAVDQPVLNFASGQESKSRGKKRTG